MRRTKKTYMNINQLIDMLLEDSERVLVFDSECIYNSDGTWSFIVRNPRTGQRWLHTVKTEDIAPGKKDGDR